MPGPVRPPARRCVVLFAREAHEEARCKRIPRAAPLFDHTERRIGEAVLGLPGVELLVFRPGLHREPPAGARVHSQRGRHFADRLENAFEDARSMGYEQVLAIGGDSPGLSAAHLAAAFEQLDSKPFVFGPAADGGVYLVGAARGARLRFGEIPWQTARTFRGLIEVHAGAAVLPGILFDLDGEDDLRALRHRMLARPGAVTELDDELRVILLDLFSRAAVRGPWSGALVPAPGTTRAAAPRGPPGAPVTHIGPRAGGASPLFL